MLPIVLSLIFPGLGQFYYGKNKRGIAMVITAFIPFLYPVAVVWSVIDVLRLNKQGLEPSYTKKDAIWTIALLLVVVPISFVILGFSGANLAIWVNNEFIAPKETATEGHRIVAAIEGYKEEHGEYPENIEKLIKGRPPRSSWRQDSWNAPYLYEITENGQNYRLSSKGKDNIPGTRDDIIFR